MNLFTMILDWLSPKPTPVRQIDRAFMHEKSRAVRLRANLVAGLAQGRSVDYFTASDWFNQLSDEHWLIIFNAVAAQSETQEVKGSEGHGIAPGFNILVAPLEDLEDYRLNWHVYVPHMRHFATHREWREDRYLANEVQP